MRLAIVLWRTSLDRVLGCLLGWLWSPETEGILSEPVGKPQE